jgi:hypothetical protein
MWVKSHCLGEDLNMDIKQLPKSLVDHLRVVRTDKIRIKLCFVSWPSPSDPVSNWRTIKALNGDLSDVEVQQYVDKIITQGRHIKLCKECYEYHVNEHMFDKDLCESCARDTPDVPEILY